MCVNTNESEKLEQSMRCVSAHGYEVEVWREEEAEKNALVICRVCEYKCMMCKEAAASNEEERRIGAMWYVNVCDVVRVWQG